MKKATLETILDRACFFGLRGFERSDLAQILPEMQGDKKGLLIEPLNKALFEQNAFGDINAIPNFSEKNGWQIISNDQNFESNGEKIINCYANISALKRKFARIAVLLPKDKNASTDKILTGIENSCLAVFSKNDLQEAKIDDLLKLKIAQINIPKTPLFLAAKYAWIFTLLLCILPFLIASQPDERVSNLRSITSEVQKYSEKGDIVHILKEGESLTQIARFAIGKYNSLVSTEAMIKEYLQDNELSLDSKLTAGDTLRLKLPTFNNPQHKTMQGAWNFFTGLLNDSLAYITELYNPTQTATIRRHDGIDVAGRKGTRILAPFSGTAWTMEDERGGLMIAIARENDLLVFMHCEQRFYLNGQSVMEGDPIASVGSSGHTTGPHVHVAAGKISKNGERNISGLRYNALNPFIWFKEM
ncbi:MAG: M23 family metallopeptidase [Fibromonadaceae bacterium]|jgi:murein DD-endopeptidase MepM/ murein hydrolase activator NlpD|nr:M23 family metallopeptidase [Fibromonadaceae bacterium]